MASWNRIRLCLSFGIFVALSFLAYNLGQGSQQVSPQSSDEAIVESPAQVKPDRSGIVDYQSEDYEVVGPEEREGEVAVVALESKSKPREPVEHVNVFVTNEQDADNDDDDDNEEVGEEPNHIDEDEEEEDEEDEEDELDEKYVKEELELFKSTEEAPFVDDLLIYVRPPKTGGLTFGSILGKSAQENGWKGHHSRNFKDRQLHTKDMRDAFVSNVLNHEKPWMLNRQMYFTNFLNYTKKSPMFISSIRDPLNRFISRYNYMRHESDNYDFRHFDKIEPLAVANISVLDWKKKDLTECVLSRDPECYFEDGTVRDFFIAYHCGHEEGCRQFNSDWALQTAKSNVERFFKVVGVLEELDKTIAVLEHRVPTYFKGLTSKMRDKSVHQNRGKKHIISSAAEDQLRKNLACEYDFYYFAKARLARQFKETTP